LNQNQFDALVSFAFNVGDGAFRSSTLLRLLNQGQYDQVPAQLRRWNMDNGHVVQGLINRRNKEIALWNTPV
jgi:lysozyme